MGGPIVTSSSEFHAVLSPLSRYKPGRAGHQRSRAETSSYGLSNTSAAVMAGNRNLFLLSCSFLVNVECLEGQVSIQSVCPFAAPCHQMWRLHFFVLHTVLLFQVLFSLAAVRHLWSVRPRVFQQLEHGRWVYQLTPKDLYTAWCKACSMS